MVTKREDAANVGTHGFILAKNHMVTKPLCLDEYYHLCFILAKNHMVTKPCKQVLTVSVCFILAKNHMVTKRLSFIYSKK